MPNNNEYLGHRAHTREKLTYCQLDHREQISLKCQRKQARFTVKKIPLEMS